MKYVSIGDFLTKDQVLKCIELRKAKAICEQVIEPNIKEINQKVGQENDPMYLAYMIEFAIERTEHETKDQS